MEISDGRSAHPAHLGEVALERVAGTLSDLYYSLYEERPLDPHASLTGNLLAFVFEDGLSVADRWLLRSGRLERLVEFREQFFDVVRDEMVEVVGDLTGMPVTYSFFGFDPTTRTSHAIFVLDMSRLHGTEQRQAVLNWSEQVRRNARRLREQHRAAREVHLTLKEQVIRKADEVGRGEADEGAAAEPSDGR